MSKPIMVMMWMPEDIQIRTIGWEHCRPRWSWDRSQLSPDYYDLWYVVDGRGYVTDRMQEVEINQGDLLLYPPQPHFSARQDPERRLIVCFIHFYVKNDRLLRSCLSESDQDFALLSVKDREWAASLFRRCWLCEQPRTGWRQQAWIPAEHEESTGESRLWLSAILNEMSRWQEREQSSEQEIAHGSELSALCEKIRREPEVRWQAEDMAESLALSASHFNRVFREYTGLSPRAFMIRARIDQARSLLMFSDRSIAQIAEQLGYPDAFSFSKQFTKELGESPSEWRKRQG